LKWYILLGLDKEYEEKIKHLNREIQDSKSDKILIAKDVENASDNMTNLAALLEDKVTTELKLNQIKWFGESIETAVNHLQDASDAFQRQFTPRLQELLDRGLRQATNGRYSESRIDSETLNVELLAPETQNWIHVDQLSTGTRDLVYLLLRFSLARLMSGSIEHLPMLLDDPFVHCDRDRKSNILNYLIEQSSDMQFILFTQDDWIKDWFLENHSENNIIEMSYESNSSIDYGIVDTLQEESEHVRERLSVSDENREDNITISVNSEDEPNERTSQYVSSMEIEHEANLNIVIDSNNIVVKILEVLKKSNWQAEVSGIEPYLEGQFLNVILDNLNDKAVEYLGDQLIYLEDDQLIVTEEFRVDVDELLGQL